MHLVKTWKRNYLQREFMHAYFCQDLQDNRSLSTKGVINRSKHFGIEFDSFRECVKGRRFNYTIGKLTADMLTKSRWCEIFEFLRFVMFGWPNRIDSHKRWHDATHMTERALVFVRLMDGAMPYFVHVTRFCVRSWV